MWYETILLKCFFLNYYFRPSGAPEDPFFFFLKCSNILGCTSGESQLFQVIGSNHHSLRVYMLNLCLLGAVEKAPAKRKRLLRLFPDDT